jgi:hypothetical protein
MPFHAGSFVISVFSAAVLLSPAAAKPRPSPVPPAPQTTPAPPVVLDQKKIHSFYNDGDFETVIAIIDTFTRANPAYGKADSVFIAKHLAVIYTANPATREKGKSYMFRLLDLLPSAKIVDMFVSDEIDHIFEKVREEFVVHQQMQGKDEPSRLESYQYAADRMKQNAPRDSAATPSPKAADKASSGHALYWTAGGLAAVTIAAAATYFLLPRNAKEKSYDVP